MKVEASRLRSLLGLTTVTYHQGHHQLAIVDSALGMAPAGATDTASATSDSAVASAPAVVGDALVIRIDNFSFTPAELHVPRGRKVMWVNADDVPHLIVSRDGDFRPSPPLDTNEQYTLVLDRPGAYTYYCSIHPKMVGRLVVE